MPFLTILVIVVQVLIALGGGSLVLVVCLYKAISYLSSLSNNQSFDSAILNTGYLK